MQLSPCLELSSSSSSSFPSSSPFPLWKGSSPSFLQWVERHHFSTWGSTLGGGGLGGICCRCPTPSPPFSHHRLPSLPLRFCARGAANTALLGAVADGGATRPVGVFGGGTAALNGCSVRPSRLFVFSLTRVEEGGVPRVVHSLPPLPPISLCLYFDPFFRGHISPAPNRPAARYGSSRPRGCNGGVACPEINFRGGSQCGS